MKTLSNRNSQYAIDLKLSIILSEIIFICLFYFFPEIEQRVIKKSDDPIILIDEIPITVQPGTEPIQKPIPPKIIIEDIIEEPQMLTDITIREKSENSTTGEGEQDVVNGSLFLIPKLPRQILEVLPGRKRGNIFGSVKLSLKINEIGKVIDHKILYNNLRCEDCLSEILAAAYKSKWESGIQRGTNKEYWVEKTYSFY